MKTVATIVIPTFNRVELLPMAIASALEQSVPCEVIVVDHGSSDRTAEAMVGYSESVTYVRRDFDSGPQFSWLDGVTLANHEPVKILHDDDWLDPNYMERCLELLVGDVGFVFSGANLCDGNAQVIDQLFLNILPRTGTYGSSSQRRLVAEKMISPTAMLMRKHDLIDGIYLERLPFQSARHLGAGADHYIKLLAMLRYPKFGFVNAPLASFRSHPGSITIASNASGSSVELARVYRQTFDFYLVLLAVRRLRLIQLLGWTHLLRRKLLRVAGVVPSYIRQVQRVGLVPLRLQARKASSKPEGSKRGRWHSVGSGFTVGRVFRPRGKRNRHGG